MPVAPQPLTVDYDRHTIGRVVVSADGMVSLGDLAAPPFARRTMATDPLRASRAFLRREVNKFASNVRGRLIVTSPFVGTRFHPALMFAFMDHFRCGSREVRDALGDMCTDCDTLVGVDTTHYVRESQAAYDRQMASRDLVDSAIAPASAAAPTPPPPPPPPPPPTVRECHICYEDYVASKLVACGTCTCVCCKRCIKNIMRVAATTPKAKMGCPVCRSGMSAASCLRRIQSTVVNVDYTAAMAKILQMGDVRAGHAQPYQTDAYHDITIVWDGMCALTDEQWSFGPEVPNRTMAQQIDAVCGDSFDGMDVIPWSALGLASFDDYSHMWRAIREHVLPGALVVTDPILDEPGDEPVVFMFHSGAMRPVDETTRYAVALAVRAARDRVPEHRRTHRASRFGLVCDLRASKAKLRRLQRRLNETASV